MDKMFLVEYGHKWYLTFRFRWILVFVTIFSPFGRCEQHFSERMFDKLFNINQADSLCICGALVIDV